MNSGIALSHTLGQGTLVPPTQVQEQAKRLQDRPSPPQGRSFYVYGDSTPFPSDFDFIATIRQAVVCGVSLMKSQHAIDGARESIHAAEEHLRTLRAELGTVAESVDQALLAGGPRKLHVREICNRIAAMARGEVAAEIQRAQGALQGAASKADKTIVEARKAAAAALGELMAHQELPGSSTGFRVFAEEQHYGIEVIVSLQCGLRATFEAPVPEGHDWNTLKRVRDLVEGLTVTLPQQVGWLSKRVEPVAQRLDGLMILGASLEGTRGALLLGKNERAGVSHALDIDTSTTTPRAKWRDVDDSTPVDLDSADAATVSQLLHAVERATRDFIVARRTMIDATLEGQSIGQCEPRATCACLVGLVAADVREIARRSGAPGELVLRRNVDSGRRDELFVTTAELLEQVETLPPSMRVVFGPLELDGMPRSPRAPARSLVAYEEISASEVLPVDEEGW